VGFRPGKVEVAKMFRSSMRDQIEFGKTRSWGDQSVRYHIGAYDGTDTRYSHVALAAQGRFMRPDESEHDCVVDEMSPFDATISCEATPDVGERIVAYFDQVGRIEGYVTECGHQTFRVSISATDYKRSKLSAQLTWIANSKALGLPEDRRHERVAPSNSVSEVKFEDGISFACRIIDLSVSGAAIETDVRPDLGTMIMLGNMRGRVVRHFQDGVAIEFVATQPTEVIEKLSWRSGIEKVRTAA